MLEWGQTGSTISGAGTLTLGGTVYVSYVASGSNTASISAPVALGATRIFNVESDGETANPGLTVSSIISGAFGLTKEGAGKMVLSGSSTYTGLTTISEGELRLGAAGGAANTPLGTTAAGTTVTSGAVLGLNGYTLGAAEPLTLNGTGISDGGALTNISSTSVNYSGLITLGSLSSIIASQGDINITNAGTITGATFNLTLGGVGNGSITSIIGTTSGSLIKTGAGTWTLSGANTYTGGTTITSGTLTLGAANRLADAGQVILDGGTFKTGTTVGYSETVGTLKLTNNSTIALGTGVHTLTFTASGGIAWTSGKILTITGWTGGYNCTSGTSGKIFAGNSAAGLTAGQLSQILFYDGSSYFPTNILASGEIVACSKTITTGTITGSPFCAGTAVSVPFTIAGCFIPGNVFTAQLSNSSGSFASPVNIGTLASIVAGTIPATIPVGTSTGTGYRIRVVSDSPVATGTDNGSNLTINALLPVSVSIVASANPICSDASVTFTATPTNGGTTPSYQWKLDGSNVGIDDDEYTNGSLSDGNQITCILTSNYTCPSDNPATSNTVTMSVTIKPVATFSYTGTPYFHLAPDPAPTFSGGGVAGSFSADPAGLVFVSTATGQVDLSASTPGTYTVTNTIAAAGACGVVIATSPITIVGDLHWTGAVNTDWNQSGNWTSGILPDVTTDVHIQDVPNKPFLSTGATGAVNNITIDNSSSLTVTGNTLQIAGSVTNNGTFTATDGTIDMRGSAAQIIDANLFAGNTINSLIINNPAGVTLQGPLGITGIVTPLSGDLISNGNLLLLSTVGQTALINGAGTGTVTGNVTMQRYLSQGFGYKYFSSPFQAAKVSEFGDDMNLAAPFPAFYAYDENRSSSGWVTYTNPAGNLDPMHGYAVNFGSNPAAKTVDITGTVNNGNLSRTIYNHDSTFTKGFNLAGNPYPSPIDWDAASGWTKTNIDDALYYFSSSTTDQYGGSYGSYAGGISSDGEATNIIPSMQGFFVHVSDLAYPVTGTLAMDNNVRITDLTHPFAKSKGTVPYFLIRLTATFTSNPSSPDPTVIYFNNKANAGFDSNLDALKLLNTDLNVPNVYSILPDGTKLSIDALPEYTENKLTIPLGLITYINGEIIFRIRDIENIPPGMSIYLQDATAGKTQDILPGNEYKIYLNKGVYSSRFSLKFLKNSTMIPDINPATEYFSAWSAKGIVKVNIGYLEGKEGDISLFALTGNKVFTKNVYEEGYLEFYPQVKTGIYIVSFRSGNIMETKKIFIHSK